MTEAPQTLSATEVENIMKAIEIGEGAGVPVVPIPPVAIPGATAVTEATPIATVGSPLQLREFVNPEQLKRDVEFNPNDLDNAVMTHAGLFVHYANLARLARRQYERMKSAAEVIESALDREWRLALKESGEKVTEAMVANAVKCDRRWRAAQERLIDAKAIYDLANDAREAFAQRKDMIVQISVDRRREKEGQLRVMGEEALASARAQMLEQARAAGAAVDAAKAAA